MRQTSIFPAASFRFRLATDTLDVLLTPPLAGRVDDFHLQVIFSTSVKQTAPVPALRAMPGAPKKKAQPWKGPRHLPLPKSPFNGDLRTR